MTESGCIEPVPFTEVQLCDAFWAPRLDTNRRVTIPFAFRKCEESERIANFEVAGGLREGRHQGKRYNDSDVFKGIEAAAYSLSTHPDPELDRYLDELIAKIAAAQEEDGYLYTARTCDPARPAQYSGTERWSYLKMSHELYNAGHLYEAAVAHHQATGKRILLDVALRNADLVARTFGPGLQRDVPGHQEIEIGLVKLYRVTGERRYLDLAHFFLEERGRANGRGLYGRYVQDHAPVVEQDEAVGHAVRAAYMYAAMADVAALTGDERYVAAIERIWENVLQHKIYLSGGIGARRGNEGFDRADHLPNEKAYNETCAAIANAMWNHRMFLIGGDAKYLDVFERVVFNGLLAGISLSGDRFFYPNPLAADGRFGFNFGDIERRPWFECSCCPQNIARFLASFTGYLYARRGDVLFVNLYASGEARVQLETGELRLRQESAYPWSGRVEIELQPEREMEFELRLRVPGWARGEVFPSDLYRGEGSADEAVSLAVDGAPVELELVRGFAALRRRWRGGERVVLELPMVPRRVRAHARVAADRGRVALERGPLLYCVEGVDHGGRVSNLVLAPGSPLADAAEPALLGGCVLLRGELRALAREEDELGVREEARPLVALPYHLWAHREVGEMAVWIPEESGRARPVPFPSPAARSAASASFQRRGGEPQLDLRALNDQDPPASSSDRRVGRFHFWPHRGSAEWVQYELPSALEIAGVELYWFADRRPGGCRPPASWRLLHREGEAWKEVRARGAYGTEVDRLNRTLFAPVVTEALRVELRCRQGCSAGILEWRLLEAER